VKGRVMVTVLSTHFICVKRTVTITRYLKLICL